MKTIALLLAVVPTLALAGALDRATPAPSAIITAAQASAIKTYTVKEISTLAPSLQGQIVKVKFNRTSKTFGGTAAMIPALADLQGGYIGINVPPEGLAWLAKLPSGYEGNKVFFAFARVEGKGQSEYGPQLTILGKEIHTDMKGATFTW